MSFRVIFVVTRSAAPPNGELVGDVLYVSAPDGYRNIVYKVKHMMGLVRDRHDGQLHDVIMIGNPMVWRCRQQTTTSHAAAVCACEARLI